MPGEPFNFRGGDDQDYIASLFHALERDGASRGILLDEFYFLSDDVLAVFKGTQGIPVDFKLSGPRVGQAHLIWQQMEVAYYEKLMSWAGRAFLANEIGSPVEPLDYFMAEVPWNEVN